MLDRLEKFEAPASAYHMLYPLLLVGLALFAACIPAPSSKQAEAPSGASTATLQMAHPLGCPEEDELGRPLKATLSIKGEKRPRCVYSSGAVNVR